MPITRIEELRRKYEAPDSSTFLRDVRESYTALPEADRAEFVRQAAELSSQYGNDVYRQVFEIVRPSDEYEFPTYDPETNRPLDTDDPLLVNTRAALAAAKDDAERAEVMQVALEHASTPFWAAEVAKLAVDYPGLIPQAHGDTGGGVAETVDLPGTVSDGYGNVIAIDQPDTSGPTASFFAGLDALAAEAEQGGAA